MHVVQAHGPVGGRPVVTYTCLKLHSNQKADQQKISSLALFRTAGTQNSLTFNWVYYCFKFSTDMPFLPACSMDAFHPWEASSQEEQGPGFNDAIRDLSSVSIFPPPAPTSWFLCSASPLSP